METPHTESIWPSPLRRYFPVVLLALALAWSSPLAQAQYSNTAFGDFALKSVTIGNNDAAIGYSALFKNTSGERNTAIGTSALYSNTNGNYITANGYLALFGNTTGKRNTALFWLPARHKRSI